MDKLLDVKCNQVMDELSMNLNREAPKDGASPAFEGYGGLSRTYIDDTDVLYDKI